MTLSQSFLLKVNRINEDKDKLIQLMSELDAQKNAARAAMRDISNTPAEEGGLSGRERNRTLRKLRTKIDFLKIEREYVKNKIAEIKKETKRLNRISNNSTPRFQAAFMAAAEKLLDEKTFLDIESKAATIMASRKEHNSGVE
jgi:PAB1-binding protein PBP1